MPREPRSKVVFLVVEAVCRGLANNDAARKLTDDNADGRPLSGDQSASTLSTKRKTNLVLNKWRLFRNDVCRLSQHPPRTLLQAVRGRAGALEILTLCALALHQH